MADPLLDVDVIARARRTVEEVMDGRGGRNALARLKAAQVILSGGLLSSLSDDELLAEVDRRAKLRAAAK
jgi:hypothetical protein